MSHLLLYILHISSPQYEYIFSRQVVHYAQNSGTSGMPDEVSDEPTKVRASGCSSL